MAVGRVPLNVVTLHLCKCAATAAPWLTLARRCLRGGLPCRGCFKASQSPCSAMTYPQQRSGQLHRRQLLLRHSFWLMLTIACALQSLSGFKADLHVDVVQ